MPTTSRAQLESAIRSSWCIWTADPVDQPIWSLSNPAWGQCASTALIVQDMLGGQLLIAEVQHRDGTRQGVHFSNRLADGTEVDLTREQFVNGEIISKPRLVRRPADTTSGRIAGQYRLLATAIARRLKGASALMDAPDRSASKASAWTPPAGCCCVATGEPSGSCREGALRPASVLSTASSASSARRPGWPCRYTMSSTPMPSKSQTARGSMFSSSAVLRFRRGAGRQLRAPDGRVARRDEDCS